MSDNIKMTGKDLATVFKKSGFLNPKKLTAGLSKTRRAFFASRISNQQRIAVAKEVEKAVVNGELKMTPYERRLLKKRLLNPMSVLAPVTNKVADHALLRREKIARHQAFIDELKEKRAAKEAQKKAKEFKKDNIKHEIKRDYLAEAEADKKKGDVFHDLAEKGKQKVAADKVKPNVPKPAPVKEEEKELLDMPIG